MVVINGIKEGLGLKIRKGLTGSSAYGVRGYGAFHYGAGANVHGIYRVRHRWGKVIQEKLPFYIPTNPQSDPQQSNRLRFDNLVAAWQGLTDEQKEFYNKLKKPKGMSGYNRYLRTCMLDPFGLYCPMPNFLELNDTPASYAGQAGKYVLVNATEDALEFGVVDAANKALSNLASVSINSHLNFATSLYLGRAAYYRFYITGGFLSIQYNASDKWKFYIGIFRHTDNLSAQLGHPSYYFAYTYSREVWFNATANLEGRTAGQIKFTGDLVPATDDVEWIGEIGSPFKAIKGLVVKDTTDGKHYKVEVVNGALTATALD